MEKVGSLQEATSGKQNVGGINRHHVLGAQGSGKVQPINMSYLRCLQDPKWRWPAGGGMYESRIQERG